jgi:hypothetical protein
MALFIRSATVRALLFLGAAVLLGAVAMTTRERWRRTMDDPVRRQQKRGDELERKIKAVLRRLERKERIVKALLAGRLTLLEAASRFRALNQGPPEFSWDRFRDSLPGDSDDERHCYEVIEFVYNALRQDDPRRAAEVRECLRAQLREDLRCGPLRLPESEEACEGPALTPRRPSAVVVPGPGRVR